MLTLLADAIGRRLTPAVVTAETTGYVAANLLDGNRHTFWRAAGTTSTDGLRVAFDAGTSQTLTADAVALARADLLAASSFLVAIEYSTSAASATSGSWSAAQTWNPLATGDLRGPAWTDAFAVFSALGKRSWRLRVACSTETARLACWDLGVATTLPPPTYEGQFGGARPTAGADLTLGFAFRSASEARTLLQALTCQLTPDAPLDGPYQTAAGAAYGGRAAWLYDAEGHLGLTAETTTPALLHVLCVTPGVRAVYHFRNAYTLRDWTFRQLV